MAFEVYALCFLGVGGVNAFDTTLHCSLKSEVLVFVGFINEQCVYAHLVEVLYIVGFAVEHFLCFGFGVVLGLCLAFFVFGFAFVLNTINQIDQFKLCLVEFAFSLLGNDAVGVFCLELLQHHLFLRNLILNEFYTAFIAIGNALKYRLRHDNHIPVVVFDFGVEVPASFRVAVCVLKCQNLCVGV